MLTQLRNMFVSSGVILARSPNHLKLPKFCQSLKRTSVMDTRKMHTTIPCRSLNEFFDDPQNYGEKKVRSGRPWLMEDLRLKSNGDLHKLWFVLYKERNMLYTMKEAARHDCEIFPSPERIDKVEESMANLENIVRERNKAYWHLEVSPCADGERVHLFRRDIFGIHRWHKCSQHLISYKYNSKFRNSQGPSPPTETDWFVRQYRSMLGRAYNRFRSNKARRIRHILRRFPDADIDFIAKSNPEFPDGYIKHLKENLHLYKDRPTKLTRLASIRSVRYELNRVETTRVLE